MATTTQTVIIDFQSDFSSLQDAVTILEKTGKVDKELADAFKKTNVEINKQSTALDKAATSANKDVQTFSKLNDLLKQFPKSGLNRFFLQIGKELTDAGVSADLFFKKSKEGNDLVAPKFDSLKLQLAAVKKRMEEAAKTSGVLSKEYLALKEQAGALSNAIKDISSDIANAGSDTRSIDNVVGSVSALAGGFSAVQGATALFGDESEDLQRALLKVNAAMALSTGLQQVLNATTKTGAITRLADATATGVQTAAQQLYALVVGQSVGALKVFKIALATTGIGLLVIGVGLLINKFMGASSAAKNLTKDLEDLRSGTDAAREGIQQQGEVTLALLEEQGVQASKLSKEKLQQIENELAAEQAGLNKLFARQAELRDLRKANSIRGVVDQIKGIKEVEAAIDVSEKNIRELRAQTQIDGIKIRTQEKDEAKKDADERARLAQEYADKQRELNEKALEAARKQRALEFADFQAGIELRLLAAEKGGEEELDLQKKLLRAKLLIDLEGEDLTLNQRKLLIQQFFKDRLELEKTFTRAGAAAAIEDQKNRDAALLENLNLAEDEKLALRIEYLRLTAAQEITAAEGNAAKILAINAKLNADIVALKVEAIKKAADYEISLASALGGTQRRALESVVNNEKLKTETRINSLRNLTAIELFSLDRQIKANRDAAQIQGSDQQALALEYAQLLDQKAAKSEDTEAKITKMLEDENSKRIADNIAYIQATVAGLQQLGDIVAGIQANQQQATEIAIERRRTEIEELLESGAITEKEARERNRRLEAEERQAKNRAAQQQKNLAVFQAFLAIPQAFIAGLTAPFPIGGPIYGAILAGIAASQAAIVASRPVPRFATGKKGTYEGLGVVGDAGAELVQRSDGSMHVAMKPELVYLGSRDKVFTAGETARILPMVNKAAMNGSTTNESFDYKKMAAAMGKGSNTSINIDKEFISESVADGLMRVNYHDRYYTSKM